MLWGLGKGWLDIRACRFILCFSMYENSLTVKWVVYWQITISYVELAASTETRCKALRDQYYFNCGCSRCSCQVRVQILLFSSYSKNDQHIYFVIGGSNHLSRIGMLWIKCLTFQYLGWSVKGGWSVDQDGATAQLEICFFAHVYLLNAGAVIGASLCNVIENITLWS